MWKRYYRVCDALLLKGEVDDPLTEIIADKIVALVKAGEHDVDRLVERVLNHFVDNGLAEPNGEPHAAQSPEPIGKSPSNRSAPS